MTKRKIELYSYSVGAEDGRKEALANVKKIIDEIYKERGEPIMMWIDKEELKEQISKLEKEK